MTRHLVRRELRAQALAQRFGGDRLSLIQDDGGNLSDPFNLDWIRDISDPDVQFDTTPSDPNLWESAVFEFSSTDGTAVFECRLDGAAWSALVVAYAESAAARAFVSKGPEPRLCPPA